ncbi:hypothetical protein MXB_2923 [Myxobolus squamalis]|nr:hypothetical protein MXB_2923 [Myxobolus squamalis]
MFRDGVHSCKQPVVDAVVDIQCFIREFFISEAKNLQKYPSLIYQSLLTAVHGNFPAGAFRHPSRKILLERIQQLQGNNTNIENIDNPLFFITSESVPFLWRNLYGNFGGRYNRIVIWAKNEGLAVLCMESSVIIDATF